MRRYNQDARRGAAAAELAVIVPFLAFVLVIAADFARIFYYSVTLAASARQGAICYSDLVTAPQSPYVNYTAAVLSDATNLNPQPTVTTNSVPDGLGNVYMSFTASGTFSTVTGYPGIPKTVNLSRTVMMRIPRSVPK
jgi:Flp pilus assembly pilin Flp